jgi:Zinc finger, C2H2 type
MEEQKKKGKNDGDDSMKVENEESQNPGEIDGETSLRTYYEAIKSSSKRMFKCLMCGKNLCGALTNFKQHVWSSHNKEAKKFGMVAPTAKQKFASLKNKGSSAGNSSEEYECEHCHRFYKTFYSCHMHKKRDHAEIMFPFTCSHCAKRFETKEKIDDHIFVQHENLKCKICKLQFESRPAYNLHNFVHCNYVEEFIDPDQKYVCSLCAFQCDDDEFLQGHLVTHANDFFEKSYLVCIWCSQTFKDFEELVNHTNDHNLRITHRCLRCFKTFPYGDRLLRHLKRYQDSYTCDYCGHCESGKARLEEHIRVKHMAEICFLCPFCGESKSSEHALKNHIKTRHEVEKKFKCDQCPKAFSNASFYRNHQSVHTNVKVISQKRFTEIKTNLLYIFNRVSTANLVPRLSKVSAI